MAVCGMVPRAQEQTGRERGCLRTGDPGESLELLTLIFPPAAIPASEARRRESPAAVGTDLVSSGYLPVGVRSLQVLPQEQPEPPWEPALGMQSLPYPAFLGSNQGSACVRWLGTRGARGSLSPGGSLCALSLPLSPSVLPAEGLHYSPGSPLGPQAPRWVWLVRGASESWEGGLQKGEAGHSPSSSSPPPLPLSLRLGCHLSSVLLQRQALASWGPSLSLQPQGASSFLPMRCVSPSSTGWLLCFPSSEQPAPHIEFSVLNTQRSFCFSWLDLVIHPGLHLKGKGSWSQRAWTKAPAPPLPPAGPWTSHSLPGGGPRLRETPISPHPQCLLWPCFGPFLPVQVECMHKWPQGFSLC